MSLNALTQIGNQTCCFNETFSIEVIILLSYFLSDPGEYHVLTEHIVSCCCWSESSRVCVTCICQCRGPDRWPPPCVQSAACCRPWTTCWWCRWHSPQSPSRPDLCQLPGCSSANRDALQVVCNHENVKDLKVVNRPHDKTVFLDGLKKKLSEKQSFVWKQILSK